MYAECKTSPWHVYQKHHVRNAPKSNKSLFSIIWGTYNTDKGEVKHTKINTFMFLCKCYMELCTKQQHIYRTSSSSIRTVWPKMTHCVCFIQAYSEIYTCITVHTHTTHVIFKTEYSLFLASSPSLPPLSAIMQHTVNVWISLAARLWLQIQRAGGGGGSLFWLWRGHEDWGRRRDTGSGIRQTQPGNPGGGGAR